MRPVFEKYSEEAFDNNRPWFRGPLKAIIIFLGVVLGGCGVVYGLFYLTLKLPYMRADIAIGQAKTKVTPLYDQLSAITSSAIQVKSKTGVLSGMYAFSLSDSADQYAHVWAEVDLQSAAPAEEVIAPYRTLWLASGFSEVSFNNTPPNIRALFQYAQDDGYVAGICHVSKSSDTETWYVAFIDYTDGPRCDNPSGRLTCVIADYCAD